MVKQLWINYKLILVKKRVKYSVKSETHDIDSYYYTTYSYLVTTAVLCVYVYVSCINIVLISQYIS